MIHATLMTLLYGLLVSTSEESEEVSEMTVLVTMYCWVRLELGWWTISP
jgi:hypothetical protein